MSTETQSCVRYIIKYIWLSQLSVAGEQQIIKIFFIELRNNKSMHTDLVLHTKSRVAIKAPLHPALQTLGKVANGLGESGRNGSQDIGYQEPDYALVEDVVTGG